MPTILGLDVSTSVTGVCLLDADITKPTKSRILLLDGVEFKKCKTFWEKTDKIRDYFLSVSKNTSSPDVIVIEEALLGFRPGLSSATTISTLMRFNGIVSYITRDIFGKDPEYISSSHARKLCGIKLKKTSEGGPQKEQVFDHFSKNDLNHVSWPLKKNGDYVDWSRDATDSYCVANAMAIQLCDKK